MGTFTFGIIIIIFNFPKLILTCKSWIIYVSENNDSGVTVIITQLIWNTSFATYCAIQSAGATSIPVILVKSLSIFWRWDISA